MRECWWQIRGNDARDQECQPDEAEAVQDEQRPQCFGPFPEAKFRPDISSGDYPPGDQAECDAHEKPDHLLWHDECLHSPNRFPTSAMRCGTRTILLSGTRLIALLGPSVPSAASRVRRECTRDPSSLPSRAAAFP